MKRLTLVLTVLVATLVVASGVALAVTKVGGPSNDGVLGTEGPDDLAGGLGSDSISGLGGNDVMWGGLLRPRPGEFPPPEVGPNNDDFMSGGSDNDFMTGDMGSDTIISGTGNDMLFDGEEAGGASDVLIGGPGNDVLVPLNDPPAGQDLIVCGAGTDVAHVDRSDVVVGCERVLFRDATETEFEQYLAERGLLERILGAIPS
jgi:Ca2+-binding RTX toxin-like protein